MKKCPAQDQQEKVNELEVNNDAKDIQEKMKKVEVKSSSVSSLAKNDVLLPSGIARVKQFQEARAVTQTRSSSSGSATGELIH